ncbi:FecR family protein [Caulobacter sp. RL271]|uniref:FecR domain-containing protein n=1 Tax=Caulobacter segnis TaxID=88688 RepID=A0ABY4ZVT4_9CAUL|nr:FecR domain-containing protein [Caulobacter segnis]USQ96595.1 FecR domain-containing protein [Caulobacter segnis]
MTPRDEMDPRRLLAASLTRSLTMAERAALDVWEAGSAEAREEIARTREVWLAMGLAADDPAVRALRRSVGRKAWPERRPLLAGLGLLAAALVVGVALRAQPQVETYAASEHAAARLTLADGSHVVLSPGGRLTTRFSRSARDVSLQAGDGFFEVTHDKSRPFAVAASGRTLTVLGTRFNVAGGERLTVSLVQGSLRVSQPGAPSVLLVPGQRYVGAAGVGGAARTGDVGSDAAWTEGRVVLADASLVQAAERLSRASGRRVQLTDPSLARLRVSGSLPIGRMDDVGAALEALLPVRARITAEGDLIVSPATRSSAKSSGLG